MKTKRGIERLTARECATLRDGKYSDGDGLRLVVRGETRAWTLAFTSPVTGRRREIGLGRLDEVGLAQARKDAAAIRDQVRHNIDPLVAKAEQIATNRAEEATAKETAKANAATLRRVARQYHEAEVEPKMKHRRDSARWLAAIEQHVPAALLDAPIGSIEPAALLDALRPMFQKVPETARRVKQRLDAIYDDAVLRKLAPSNPVKVIARKLKQPRSTTNWRALPFAEVPALVKRLRALPGTSARALEFAILTAARTQEVLNMEWSEINGNVWTVPADRMKTKEPHVVYLSDAAITVLKRVDADSDRWVFRSPERDAPMSNMAMLLLLRRLEIDDKTTVHGFRSAFSTWANERGIARPDVVEAALAHRESDLVRAAYNRAEFIEERRTLLAKWAAYVAPTPKKRNANVLPMKRAKA